MRENINTEMYWNTRFSNKTNWDKNARKQTKEYAKNNLKHMSINPFFEGSILDLGCATGDAIPIYKRTFPNAKLYGADISEVAINKCIHKYGGLAEFNVYNYNEFANKDIIIASHLMEHITDDRVMVNDLLLKCKEIFIFVPFKEDPLFIEHVNFYDENYYNEFQVIEKKIFKVKYNYSPYFKSMLKGLLKSKLTSIYGFSKEIIMFRIKGYD